MLAWLSDVPRARRGGRILRKFDASTRHYIHCPHGGRRGLVVIGVLWRRQSRAPVEGAGRSASPALATRRQKGPHVVAVGVVLLVFGILIALAKLGPVALAVLGVLWLCMVMVAFTAGQRRRGPPTSIWQRFVDLCRLVEFSSP